jgi:DNA repair exonuclease SbcCD ATPase subunit
VVMGVNAQENTSHDVSEVDKVIKMNMNLESKLKIANTARERAESRCALVVSELEAQKNDLIMLSAKLQRAEEKQANTSPCRSDALQVHLLRKSLSQRDAQLKGLRDSLVKLKADLVAVEQANAFGSPRRKDLPTYTPDGAVQDPRSKAKELAQQLNLIRSEARAATRKNDLFCSQRDKYKLQLDRALHKIEYLRSNAQMAESQCRELDSALTNARRECSELRAVEAKYSVTACNLVPIIFKTL